MQQWEFNKMMSEYNRQKWRKWKAKGNCVHTPAELFFYRLCVVFTLSILIAVAVHVL